MSIGTVGIVRPADVSIEDIEIFYVYSPDRGTYGGETPIKVDDVSEMLIPMNNPNRNNNTTFETFGGVYTLKLPTTIFTNKGFYNIIIKPKEIRTRIIDCGVLSAFPDIRGLVFDTATISDDLATKFENDGLVGYRVEYLNEGSTESDAKINNLYRIITSNNRAEPVNQNLTNSNQKAIRYRFNDNSTLVFCTLSPSSPPNVKPNALPYIGQPNQEVIITNTFFNPVMVEVEFVEHDIETIAYGLFSNQTKSLEDGIYTIYNFDNEIYKQYNLFEIKDRFTGKPLFEVREERGSIDFEKGFDNIIEG